jgi:hypothetical protein
MVAVNIDVASTFLFQLYPPVFVAESKEGYSLKKAKDNRDVVR